ncbi:MAG TPA: GxxExxY protein [Allosphingosinicella sp.]|jgi:GxxExxY protein
MSNVERLAAVTIDCGLAIHRDLGPGLLESVYEALLAAKLARSGLCVERQKPVDVEYEGIRLREGFRADLLIERRLIVEVKSMERLAAVHSRQVLTYLRLLGLPLGLLMNFGGATFREGVRRVMNDRGMNGPAPHRLAPPHGPA